MLEFKIYQNPEFLKILEDVYKIEKVKIFKNENLDNLTTFYKSKIKKSDIFNMPFNFYYSPFISKDIENEYFTYLQKYSFENKVNILIKSLNNYDFENKIHYAYNPILFLENDFRKNYSKNLIKNIKRNNNKANRYNIKIYKATNIKNLIDFYNNVLSVTYIDKHKMVFQPLNLYIKLFENNFMDVFIAKQNDHIIGGLCCIKDNEIYHYNWGASLNVNNIAIGTLLIDYAINYAYEKNYKIFDFGSTSLSDNDLLKFKLKWGTKNFNVYQYYTFKKPQEIDLNNSYLFIRNIYSKLPKSFLRWLMPKIVPYLVQ